MDFMELTAESAKQRFQAIHTEKYEKQLRKCLAAIEKALQDGDSKAVVYFYAHAQVEAELVKRGFLVKKTSFLNETETQISGWA